MSVVVYAKVAPAGVARFWVGLFNRPEPPTAPPKLRFRAQGQAITPVVLRPLAAFRAGALQGEAKGGRAFSGVFEHPLLPGQTALQLSVGVVGEATDTTARLSALPAQVPAEGQPLNLLLTSCYYHEGDHAQAVRDVIAALPQTARPHLTFFLGDQVYLDLPTLRELKNDAASLAKDFEARYREVWSGPYASVLGAAPSACVPDDHEYWNNYPNPFFAVQNSWSEAGRERWARAGQAAFSAFQLGSGAPLGAPISFDIPPLSFFLADTRSLRDPARGWSMAPSSLAQLRAWAQAAAQNGRYPVFVAGQSVLDGPGGAIDRALPDYADYPSIMAVLGALSQTGRCPLLITGDVHYGRVAFAVDAASGRPRAFEVISSPSSLVDTLVVDAFKGLFGGGSWPKHPAPRDPPSRVSVGSAAWDARSVHKQRGNHVTLVSFRRFAGSLQFKTTFWPVHSRQALRAPVEVGWVDLASRE